MAVLGLDDPLVVSAAHAGRGPMLLGIALCEGVGLVAVCEGFDIGHGVSSYSVDVDGWAQWVLAHLLSLCCYFTFLPLLPHVDGCCTDPLRLFLDLFSVCCMEMGVLLFGCALTADGVRARSAWGVVLSIRRENWA